MAGKDHADYYYVRWNAYAELDGEELPIVSANVTYGMDELPRARIGLAVGREPNSNEEAGTVEAFQKAYPYTSVKIYVKGETDMDSPKGKDDPGFPFNKDVMIFDGYLEGVSYQSRRSPSGGSVGLYADCVGWLAALGGSVSSTQTNTVKGPGGFDEIANLGPNHGVFDISQTFDVDERGTFTDLWFDYIKELFLELTYKENVWGDSDNQSAKDALARMDNAKALDEGKPVLAFPIARMGVSEDSIKTFLLSQIGRTIYNIWRAKDMWSVLVQAANDFKFSIVPLIDTAFCAPVFPTLSGDPFKTIGADEYFEINYRAGAQANISRLSVVDKNGYTSNPRDPEVMVSAVVGLYEIDGTLHPSDNTRGLTRELAAPLWLIGMHANGKYTRISIGGSKLGIPDAVNPDAFSETPDEGYNEIYSNYITSEIGDDYAKLMLQYLFLANRSGFIAGRFRLDIAPGSTIAIEVINDKFSDTEAEPTLIYALVTEVIVSIDSGSFGSPGAYTRLGLTHIRSKQEHEDPRITSYQHPYFETKFVGAKLWFDK